MTQRPALLICPTAYIQVIRIPHYRLLHPDLPNINPILVFNRYHIETVPTDAVPYLYGTQQRLNTMGQSIFEAGHLYKLRLQDRCIYAVLEDTYPYIQGPKGNAEVQLQFVYMGPTAEDAKKAMTTYMPAKVLAANP